MHLGPKELEEFCLFLNQEYGLSFTQEKYPQLENRLRPILETFSCRTLGDVIIRCKKDLRLHMELVNALTTNETWFFRHPSHFRILTRHILPIFLKKAETTSDNRLRIWSAGCSNGAETYSILLSLLEALKSEKINLNIVGSDLSSDAINSAKQGIFTKQELKLVNKIMLEKYFTPGENDCYRVKSEFQKMITFEVLNLLESWPARKFDIIFCRNVMIYFNEEQKKKITDRFLGALTENGYYLTSANESIHWQTKTGIKKLFIENEYLYQKTGVKESFRLYRFETPSDLLRALNLLNQVGVSYGLEKIRQTHELAPHRAIFIAQKDTGRAEELFSLSSIKIAGKQLFKK